MPPHFLTSNFRVAFEEYFQPDQQRAAVDNMKAYIAEVRDMPEERRRELDILRPQDTTQEQIDARIAAYLDKCHWQLAQFYRFSAPCRIAEAESNLREVIQYAQQKQGARRDVAPELYLAAALHKVPSKEEESNALFASAFSHFDEHGAPGLGPRSELWARAAWARLLRRMDKVPEAEVQERAIINWIVSHPSVLTPAKLDVLISEEDEGVLSNIGEYPEVKLAIQKARQRGRATED
ncbi:hypothetical protein GSI_02934 [Ganoderma sinense ZZ0214-1]|uniref:Uncharacterized protein n=1 Tax=Ganoderma sinense ZZ0214-1 TaxID=1077348 RepID=A0A2G8SMZ9_9APHY|nr:hypothetical protein GSI_02934 [Ganoderma sinense ZZ0214-1]